MSPASKYSPHDASSDSVEFRWLRTGDETFAAMLSTIETAKSSIELRATFTAPGRSASGSATRSSAPCQRGVRVQVLIDAFGSITLPDSFWQPLRKSRRRNAMVQPADAPALQHPQPPQTAHLRSTGRRSLAVQHCPGVGR